MQTFGFAFTKVPLSPGIRFIGSLAGIPDTVTHLTLSSGFPLHLFPPPKSIQNIKWY